MEIRMKETKACMKYTWDDIERHIAVCTHCPLCRTRQRPVMGRGNRKADIMLIAEAPGAQEDRQGIPFVGSSGEVLDRLLRESGLSREERMYGLPNPPKYILLLLSEALPL